MIEAIGAIAFLVLAYTVLTLSAGHLPREYAAAVPLLIPLIGAIGGVFALPPNRKREP